MFLMVITILLISVVGSGGLDSININGGSIGATIPFDAIFEDAPSYPSVSQPQGYNGALDINVLHRDVLDNTEEREENKDVRTTFYKRGHNGEFFVLGSGDYATVFIDETIDRVYFTLETVEGRDIFISPMGTADGNLNPRVIDFDYLDVDNDGQKEWVFTFDVTSLNTMGIPMPSLAIYTMSYDEGDLYLNHPSDMVIYPDNSINNIRWELDIPQETAVPIREVKLIFDTTASEQIYESGSWISVPFIDNIEFQEMDKTITTNHIEYVYNFGSDLSYADYIPTPQNGDTSHEIPVRFHSNIPEGEEISVTLEVTSITPSEAYKTVSDTVKLTANYEEKETTDIIFDANDCSVKNYRMAQIPFQIKVFHDPTSDSVLDTKLQNEHSTYVTESRENLMQFYTDSVDNFEIYYEINYDEPELRELTIEYTSDGVVIQRHNERFSEEKHCMVFYLETEYEIPTKTSLLGVAGQIGLSKLGYIDFDRSDNFIGMNWDRIELTPAMNCNEIGCSVNFTATTHYYQVAINTTDSHIWSTNSDSLVWANNNTVHWNSTYWYP